MPPMTSGTHEDHDQNASSGPLHLLADSVGTQYVGIAPARLVLYQLVPQPEALYGALPYQEQLRERALALVGGPLRPQVRSNSSTPQERSLSQLSYGRSLNKAASLLLIDLPVDLLVMFLDHLDWESLVTFRLANKFIAQLVLASNLNKHYIRCHNETAREEEWLVKEGSKRFTSRSTLGSTYGESLRAQALMGDLKRMPCYKCLRWFRCPTSKVLKESRKSLFSDLMAKPRDKHGVYRYVTRSRLCFDCGVKTDHYHKGGQFKRFIICVNCGQLGRDLTTQPTAMQDDSGKSLWQGMKLRYRYYCAVCMDSNKVPQSHAEHAHKHGKTYKYEKAMWKKKEACIAKRKALGRAKSDEENRWEVWCPIVQRKSVCKCFKAEDHWRKYYDRYGW